MKSEEVQEPTLKNLQSYHIEDDFPFIITGTNTPILGRRS